MSSYRRFPPSDAAAELRGAAMRVLLVAAVAGLLALVARLCLGPALF
jgi:hypothetical protein